MLQRALPPVHRYVGRVIQLMRKERGIKQAELAVVTGLKQPNLSRIENGLVAPRRATLEKLALALSVELKDLLSENRVRETEAKWSAALSPKNAGQLFSGKLTAVPVYAFDGEEAPRCDRSGLPEGAPELILQLPPLSGRVFALRVAGAGM